MASFIIVLPETGLTLIGQVFNSAGVQQGGNVAMTESSTNLYTGTYDESSLATGTYDEFPVLFSASSVVKGDGILKVEDGAEVNDRFLPNLDVAVSSRSDFDESSNQVIVATNNDKTDYQLANNAIDSNKVAVNAFNNSAFTTGYYNSINAEIDQALADYDAPTLAEITSAFTEIKGAGWTVTDTLEAIRDAITAIGTSATPADIWSYVTRTLTAGTKDSEIDAIKLQTDKMNFNVSNEILSESQNMRGTDGANTTIPPTVGEIDTQLSGTHGAGSWETGAGSTPLTQQEVRDAMKLAPSAGAPATDSIDDKIDDVETAVGNVPTNPVLTNDSRLDNLDATVSSRSTLTASQVWANGTRTLTSFGTLIADIWSYVTRTITGTVTTDTASREASKADVSTLATQASVDSIPTNPVLANDARLDNLDATISSRSDFDNDSETVTTDTASRDASKADVSNLATKSDVINASQL